MDLFMNCLLFNDYAISQKYHADGKLEFITTFIISTFSNLFSNILIYSMNNLKNYPELIQVSLDNVKSADRYEKMINKINKVLKARLIILFIGEVIYFSLMYYYLFIFCSLYQKSIIACMYDCGVSLIESIIIGFRISLILTELRKVGLCLKSKN